MKNICNVNARKQKTFRFFIRNDIFRNQINEIERLISNIYQKEKKGKKIFTTISVITKDFDKKIQKIFHQLFNNISRIRKQ